MEPSPPSYWNKMNQFLFRATSSLLKSSITKDFTFNSKCYDLTLQKTLSADVIGERININNADRIGESAPWERHFQKLCMRNSYEDKIIFLHSSIHSSQISLRGKSLFIKSTIEMFCQTEIMIFIIKLYLLIRNGLPKEILYKNPLYTHYYSFLLGTFISHYASKFLWYIVTIFFSSGLNILILQAFFSHFRLTNCR